MTKEIKALNSVMYRTYNTKPSLLEENLKDYHLIEVALKTLEVLQESFKKMDEKEKNEIEMKIYSRMCGSCPNAKMCHEECETCEEYDEVLACALGEDYDN